MRRQYCCAGIDRRAHVRCRRAVRRGSKLMLVTGGTGFLGRHITGTDTSKGWQIYTPNSRLLDVHDATQVNDGVRGWRPDVVIPPRVPQGGTGRGRRLGHRHRPAPRRRRTPASSTCRPIRSSAAAPGGREEDLVTPVGEYGTWKAQAEEMILATHHDALIVRTSLLRHVDPRSHPARRRRRLRGHLPGCASSPTRSAAPRTPATWRRGSASSPAERGRRHHPHRRPATREPGRSGSPLRPVDGLRSRGRYRSARGGPRASRAGRLVLDSGKAADMGIRCRSLDEVLGV